MDRWILVLISILVFTVSALLSAIDFYQPDTRVEGPSNQMLERLNAIGYLPYIPGEVPEDKKGVVYYDRSKAYDGVNIYTPQNMGVVYLMGMDGRILHTWKVPVEYASRELYAEMGGDGSIYILSRDKILKLDWDSRLQWINRGSYHHDLTLLPDGRVYALSSRGINITRLDTVFSLQDNLIVVLDANGRRVKELSLHDVVGDFLDRRLSKIKRKQERGNAEEESYLGLFHANTINLLHNDISVARSGDVIVCARNINLIFILNVERGELVWSWWDNGLKLPHYPTVLDNGNILVFDNMGNEGFSRVVEYDPLQKRFVWEYEGHPPELFYSDTRGGSQRLPNGNTLITETNRGRIFEVTRDGEIVWDFWVPDVNSKNNRAVVSRMKRLDWVVVEKLLAENR
ncbi:MAG: arylsulfotransferase family protein [Candidatus Altiarchaeota archaeon]